MLKVIREVNHAVDVERSVPGSARVPGTTSDLWQLVRRLHFTELFAETG
jgi:hypothetical protein